MATGIGETLRAARRQQGISLADAAASTRVRETYLAALEEEEFASLGGDVYVKGFLRSYARYLGLDPDPLLDSYRRDHERGDELPPLQRSKSPMPTDAPRSPAVVIAVVVAVAALLLFGVTRLVGGGGETAPPPTAPAPVESPDVDPLEEAVVGAEDGGPEVTVVEAEAVDLRVMAAGGDTVITLTADDELVFEGLLSDGDDIQVPTAQRVDLSAQDGSVVWVEVNGEGSGPLSDPAEPAERAWVAGVAP